MSDFAFSMSETISAETIADQMKMWKINKKLGTEEKMTNNFSSVVHQSIEKLIQQTQNGEHHRGLITNQIDMCYDYIEKLVFQQKWSEKPQEFQIFFGLWNEFLQEYFKRV